MKEVTKIKDVPLERHLIKKQTYTIELAEYSDNTTTLTRNNEGFSAYELMGLLEKIQLEILQQMAALIKPTETIRNVVKES